MAGNNDRIHGYNAVYRNNAGPVNFHSFDLNHGRPTNFIYRQVNIVGGGAPALDHQGHIVPQNILNVILNPLMVAMAAQSNNLGQALAFMNGPQGAPWMQLVYNYGLAIGAPMFDFDEADPEDKLGGFFSIVTWNPVNICRAPEDNRRNGVPGNNIDVEVVNYLNNNQAAQGVNAPWLASLQALVLNANNANITAYITACSNTLAGQQVAGIGYYAFPWQDNHGVLQPQ